MTGIVAMAMVIVMAAMECVAMAMAMGMGIEMTGGFGGFDDREKDLPLLIPTIFLRGPKRSSL